mgnify:CR=1 FL=1
MASSSRWEQKGAFEKNSYKKFFCCFFLFFPLFRFSPFFYLRLEWLPVRGAREVAEEQGLRGRRLRDRSIKQRGIGRDVGEPLGHVQVGEEAVEEETVEEEGEDN